MARPWKKKARWPHASRRGTKSYAVGFYDHDGNERTRAFPSAKAASEWMADYSTAERRGVDSLRRFLLDLDAREANATLEGRTIGEVIQLYFAHNAHDVADGLATSTFRTYSGYAKRHLLGHPGASRGRPLAPAPYAVQFAAQPAHRFNEPGAVRVLRDAMKHARVGPSARAHVWRVLSAVLSWAAHSDLVPEIQTNACLVANENVSNRRKSMRGQPGRVSVRRRGEEIRSWALAPIAVELIRAHMLARAARTRQPLLAYRDAAIISLAFGLGLRPHESFGVRWCSLGKGRAYIDEVVTADGLQSLGKTPGSTGRPVKAPLIMQDDLAWWRERLLEHDHPARDVDFVIPGDLAGPEFGVRDKETGAWHLSPNQIKKWGPRYLSPAVAAVADSSDAYARLRGATPYGLRRGGISMRLRCEDAQSVAHQCGTSLEMLSQHYSYEIDDYGNHGPRSVDDQWRAARASVVESTDHAKSMS